MPKVNITSHSTRGGISRRSLEAIWSEGGLAVNPSRHGWTVTHAQSGYAVAKNFTEQALAILVAGHFLQLGDWTRDLHTVRTDEALHLATKKFCDSLHNQDIW